MSNELDPPSTDAADSVPDRSISHPWAGYLACALLVAAIVLFSLIRYRLREMPLERDEGEYAYAGQLILQGIPPYQLAYNMKLPGTYVAYAAIMGVFGQTPAGIHLGIIVVNAFTAFLLFILGFRLSGRMAGVAAGAAFLVLSTSQGVLGFEGHATHFVALFAVAGALALLRAVESQKAAWFGLSGLLMGVSFVMKQPGFLFVLFGAAYLFWIQTRPVNVRALLTRIAVYLAGAALPFFIICLWMWHAGVFKRFWFWTFTYASQYGTVVTLREGVGNFGASLRGVVGPAFALWIFAALGFTALWWKKSERRGASLANWFIVFSALAVVPGLYFRSHYFLVLLPALALLAGLALSALVEVFAESRSMQALPVVVFLMALALPVAKQREYYLRLDPIDAARQTYGANPFPEALKIAEYIRSNSSENDRIAIIGSEPEIYFYAHRRGATGYIYTYALMEDQKYASTMQREMAQEIEGARPAFLVFVAAPTSWLGTPKSDPYILEWGDNYVRDHYELVGVAESGKASEYRWGAEAQSYRPRSRWVTWVFRRHD